MENIRGRDIINYNQSNQIKQVGYLHQGDVYELCDLRYYKVKSILDEQLRSRDDITYKQSKKTAKRYLRFEKYLEKKVYGN